jgi:hypothetical protein
MKISATAAFAVIACAEVVTARCFFWGWDYNEEEAKGWINDACRAKETSVWSAQGESARLLSGDNCLIVDRCIAYSFCVWC